MASRWKALRQRAPRIRQGLAVEGKATAMLGISVTPMHWTAVRSTSVTPVRFAWHWATQAAGSGRHRAAKWQRDAAKWMADRHACGYILQLVMGWVYIIQAHPRRRLLWVLLGLYRRRPLICDDEQRGSCGDRYHWGQ